MKKILALLFGLIVGFIIVEVILQIYNPFIFRYKGDKIILPVNIKYTIDNNKIERLDKKIIHTKNSLGFRGEEIPDNFDSCLSIIAVGGSTTECFYLSDNRTWPYLLGQKLKKSYKNIWLNNAGLDGSATFGHKILLEDYLIKIKPKVILFLVGINDIGRNDLNEFDKARLKNASYGKEGNNAFKQYLKRLLGKSEFGTLMINLVRLRRASRACLGHENIDLEELGKLEISSKKQRAELFKHKRKYINEYRKRLLKLVKMCKYNNIDPIFVTQPCLWGVELMI